MAPKKSSKDEKPKEVADKSTDEPKNLSNEDKKTSDSSDQNCAGFAKALIYIVPIALYIPWAYRMFKGQPCCHEVPKPPPTAGSPYGKAKWPKCPGKETGPKCPGSQKGDGEACEFEMPKECQEECTSPRKDDCKKSRQCLDKCLDKCFSKDGGKGKRGEKKRRNDCDDDDDS